MKPGARLTAVEFRPERAVASTLLVLLALLHGVCAHAVIPALPPPCPASFDSEPVATLIEQVKKAADHNPEAGREADCASQGLSHKGARVVPALISLMEMRQSDVEIDALRAVCGLGPAGAKAVPYIVERIRADDDSWFTDPAYDTLACIGKGAKPAIPLLIDRSLYAEHGAFGESESAIRTLGFLTQYAPHEILPNLIRLLDQPDHTVAAARALENVGTLARSAAAEPLRKHLSIAVNARQDYVVVNLVSALDALHETGPAVATLIELLQGSNTSVAAAKALGDFGSEAKAAIPALIGRLNASDASGKEHESDIAALIAINEPSPAVLSALIAYTTADESWNSRYSAASWLALVNPFPSKLASDVTAAITRLPEDDRVTGRLEETLEHSGALVTPAVVKSSPVDLTAQLGAGLLALTQQPHAVSVSDVVRQLGLALKDYVAEADGNDNTLSGKRDWARSTTGASPVSWVHVEGVYEPQLILGDPTLLYEQEIVIRLDPGACASIAAVQWPKTAPTPTSADLPVIEIVGSRSGAAANSLRIVGDRSADKSEARLSRIGTQVSCGQFIQMEKWFEDGYWSAACPFSADDRLVQTVIIPAVRELLGTEAGTYDLGSPDIHDFGQRTVQLGYDQVRPVAPGPDWRPTRVWLAMDRCSHKVSVISKSFLQSDP